MGHPLCRVRDTDFFKKQYYSILGRISEESNFSQITVLNSQGPLRFPAAKL